MKKTLSILLAVIMALSVFAMAVSAAVPEGYFPIHDSDEGLEEGEFYATGMLLEYLQMMRTQLGEDYILDAYYNPELDQAIYQITYKGYVGEPAVFPDMYVAYIKTYVKDIDEDLIAVKTDEDTVEHGDWFIDYAAYSANIEFAKSMLNRYTYQIGAISKKLVLTAKEDGSVTKYFVGDSMYDTYMNIIRVKHEFGEWTITDEGHSATCTFEDCGYVEEGAHVEKAIDYTVATCTVGAVYTYQCIYCGKERIDQRPAPGHTWDDGEETTPATCTEDGVMTFNCQYCDETKTEPIPAAHAWEAEGTVTTPPTCTEAGVKTFGCANCDETTTEPVAALGHDWGAWTVTKEATETEKGEKTRTCQREGCGEVETAEIPVVEPEAPSAGNFFSNLWAKIVAFFQKIADFFKNLFKK